MSHEFDHARVEHCRQTKTEPEVREIFGPVGTICGLALLLLLAALIPS